MTDAPEPCPKVAYPTKRAASVKRNEILRGVQKKRRGRTCKRRKVPDVLRAYHCPRCNKWHLTSQRKDQEAG